jgi:hypothetical protein
VVDSSDDCADTEPAVMQSNHSLSRVPILMKMVTTLAAAWLVIPPPSLAQQPASPPRDDTESAAKEEGQSNTKESPPAPAFPDPVGARRLSPR